MRLSLEKKTGPLYWCTYEYQVTNNSYMPEDRFKDNVDWIAKNYVPYGYEMICTDGWIEDSFCLNENGYLLKHHDTWKHDWLYWSDYCNERGLALGVYYNPLWISPKAVNDSHYKVVGTDIPVHDITDTDYIFEGDNQSLKGDRFSYYNGDKSLFWVDVNRPGAKEYIQGYVQFFIDNKVDFLRIDFISWYEDGYDKGTKIGRDHGVKNYRTALKWIREAAGDKIMISLVMPHLKHDGENEFGMGSMARINEDCGTGGWLNFSDKNRGIRFDYWSQFTTPFDGLIYWSRKFYEHNMIMDADMLRLNTFDNDEERKSAVSLCILSGAPLDIADQYDSIGDSGWIYQNTELLELNKEGVVCFPLSDDIKNPESEIWTGTKTNGERIVGIFNRDNKEKECNIDFEEKIGISKGKIRDLWLKKDLGVSDHFEAVLEPHGCRIISIIPDSARMV